MNEIQTIREALERGLRICRNQENPGPGVPTFIQALNALDKLLPPKGETREGYMTHDQATRYYQNLIDKAEPAPSSEKAHAVNGIECEYCADRIYASSEKALRMALICISESDPFYRDLSAEKQIEWIRYYAKKALLSSSPAPVIPRPEDVKRSGPRAASAPSAGPCNTSPPAPEAPKEEHENFMPHINGKVFRCECGCNIFQKTTDDPLVYECNSCGAQYRETPKSSLERSATT